MISQDIPNHNLVSVNPPKPYHYCKKSQIEDWMSIGILKVHDMAAIMATFPPSACHHAGRGWSSLSGRLLEVEA